MAKMNPAMALKGTFMGEGRRFSRPSRGLYDPRIVAAPRKIVAVVVDPVEEIRMSSLLATSQSVTKQSHA